ncbi:MAG: hypothetical protein EON49_07095 [Acidovorax sp.]|nr:MAG: hypothetical protein EON49_07095 [Acidovorax sp.]
MRSSSRPSRPVGKRCSSARRSSRTREAPLSRFACSPQGDATRGRAKPAPRWRWLRARQCQRLARGLDHAQRH